MFPSIGSDRERLENIVYRNCVHNQYAGVTSGTCTRTDRTVIEKCSAHQLLGTRPSPTSTLYRGSSSGGDEPSYCAVFGFYKWLLERQHGVEPDGLANRQEVRLPPAPPPAPTPAEEPVA